MVETTVHVTMSDTNDTVGLRLATGKQGVITKLTIANNSGDTILVVAKDGAAGTVMHRWQCPPMYSMDVTGLPKNKIFVSGVYFATSVATTYVTATIDET